MRNPNWKREELILALDLYFNLDQGQMQKNNPKVIKISNEIRGLNIHKNIPDKVKFRNPSGVSRKLGNFKSIDNNYKGKGLRHLGKLDIEIWNEFKDYRNKLRKEANKIRRVYLMN